MSEPLKYKAELAVASYLGTDEAAIARSGAVPGTT